MRDYLAAAAVVAFLAFVCGVAYGILATPQSTTLDGQRAQVQAERARLNRVKARLSERAEQLDGLEHALEAHADQLDERELEMQGSP